MQTPKKRLIFFFICVNLAVLFSFGQSTYTTVESLIEREEYNEAKNEIKIIFLNDTNNYDYYFLCGKINKQRDNYPTAIYQLERCIALDPARLLPYGYLSNINIRRKQYENALMYCEKALALEPSNVDFLNEKATIYYEQRQYDSAFIYLNKIVIVSPSDADFQYNAGVILNRLNRYGEAVNYFNHSDSLRPNDTKTLFDRGVAYYHLFEYAKAINDLKLSAKLNKTCPDEYIRPTYASTYHYICLVYVAERKLFIAKKYQMKSRKFKRKGR